MLNLVYVTGVVRLKFSNIWFEGMRRQDLLSSITPSGIYDNRCSRTRCNVDAAGPLQRWAMVTLTDGFT